MQLNRRAFLASAAAGAGALALNSVLRSAPAAVPADPYEIVPLGKTGLKVSRIGMGTGMRGSMRSSQQTRMGWDAFEALFKAGWERGIRLFDMADLYGSHQFVAKALAGIPREKYTLVTKIWTGGGGIPDKERPDANIVIDRFRKELNTDYIDLVQIHCQTAADWPDKQKKQMGFMEEAKSKGLIRAHGVSCHSMDALKAAAASSWVDVVHARINHVGKDAAMDGKPEDVAPLLKALHDAGKGIIGMKLIGEGRFKDAAQRDAAIKYVLGLGTVDAMVVGFEKKEEIEDFGVRVAAGLKAIEAKA